MPCLQHWTLADMSQPCWDRWAPVWASSMVTACQTLSFLSATRQQWLTGHEVAFLLRLCPAFALRRKGNKRILFFSTITELAGGQSSFPSQKGLFQSWNLYHQEHDCPSTFSPLRLLWDSESLEKCPNRECKKCWLSGVGELCVHQDIPVMNHSESILF